MARAPLAAGAAQHAANNTIRRAAAFLQNKTHCALAARFISFTCTPRLLFLLHCTSSMHSGWTEPHALLTHTTFLTATSASALHTCHLFAFSCHTTSRHSSPPPSHHHCSPPSFTLFSPHLFLAHLLPHGWDGWVPPHTVEFRFPHLTPPPCGGSLLALHAALSLTLHFAAARLFGPPPACQRSSSSLRHHHHLFPYLPLRAARMLTYALPHLCSLQLFCTPHTTLLTCLKHCTFGCLCMRSMSTPPFLLPLALHTYHLPAPRISSPRLPAPAGFLVFLPACTHHCTTTYLPTYSTTTSHLPPPALPPTSPGPS